MEIKSLKRYWASPWKRNGPRPQPACAARAKKGSAAAMQGLGPRPLSAWPAWLAEAERLAGVCTGAAARLGHEAGGHLRPRQRKQASAGGSRGIGECEQAAKQGGEGEKGGVPQRPSTAAPWPSVARRGEAHPGLRRRSKLERDLKEGEAELWARAIEEWRGGAGA